MAVRVALGLSFGIGMWIFARVQPPVEYFAGNLIEKALSVENIFVFALILGYFFSVPPKYQHRVLFFGLLGALVLRAPRIDTGKSPLVGALRRLMPVTEQYHGQEFFARRREICRQETAGKSSLAAKRRLIARPMFAVLRTPTRIDTVPQPSKSPRW